MVNFLTWLCICSFEIQVSKTLHCWCDHCNTTQKSQTPTDKDPFEWKLTCTFVHDPGLQSLENMLGSAPRTTYVHQKEGKPQGVCITPTPDTKLMDVIFYMLLWTWGLGLSWGGLLRPLPDLKSWGCWPQITLQLNRLLGNRGHQLEPPSQAGVSLLRYALPYHWHSNPN